MFFYILSPLYHYTVNSGFSDIYLQEKGGTWNHTEMDSREAQSGLASP
jgi:hypothetical protein